MDIKLRCKCGAVTGVATNITPNNGNRIVCSCNDCQAFAQHLERESDTLDEFGGTEIFQTSQSQVQIKKGAEHLRAVRLTSKGLTRWYTDCCNTPVANTINAKFPFAGLIHTFINIKGDNTQALGPVLAYVQTQHALGTPTYPHSAKKFPLGITLRMLRKIVGWKAKGMHSPSVFFNDEGQPVSKPRVLGDVQ